MRLLANELRVGDAIQLNDWELHVARIQSGLRISVTTAEFDFALHFMAEDRLNVVRRDPLVGSAA
jgi:hypothetical protein